MSAAHQKDPRMLHEFLLQNRKEILAMTEKKSNDLAGVRPSSTQLKQGLPIFYSQLMSVLQLERSFNEAVSVDRGGMAAAARNTDEPAMAKAAGQPEEAEVAKSAGIHGKELLRLGYTLSHVVHAYGAMCQSITELATNKNITITANEFHDLNRCLDIAIAGAVTEFQSHRNIQNFNREIEHLGFLAHELRNALTSVNVAIQLIKRGTVGFGGSTGHVLDRNLKRIEELIDRSMTEVRLRMDPKVHIESGYLLQFVDQIIETADIQARVRNQTLEIHIDSKLTFEADHQLLYSTLSNLIQNALKYTREGGKIWVRGTLVATNIVVEVEDECGGLSNDAATELFEPYVQRNENRTGLGLGLTIAQRAISLNHGTIQTRNLPGKGCIFVVTFPQKATIEVLESHPAA